MAAAVAADSARTFSANSRSDNPNQRNAHDGASRGKEGPQGLLSLWRHNRRGTTEHERIEMPKVQTKTRKPATAKATARKTAKPAPRPAIVEPEFTCEGGEGGLSDAACEALAALALDLVEKEESAGNPCHSGSAPG